MITLPARPESLTFAPQQSALIVVDMQNAYASQGGYLDLAGFDVSATRPVIDNINTAVAAARAAGMLIIWFQNGWDDPLCPGEIFLLVLGAQNRDIGDLILCHRDLHCNFALKAYGFGGVDAVKVGGGCCKFLHHQRCGRLRLRRQGIIHHLAGRSAPRPECPGWCRWLRKRHLPPSSGHPLRWSKAAWRAAETALSRGKRPESPPP